LLLNNARGSNAGCTKHRRGDEGCVERDEHLLPAVPPLRSRPQVVSRRLSRLEGDHDGAGADDFDWDAWQERMEVARVIREDPEVEWYEDGVTKRQSAIWRWRDRIESAKDIVGIETVEGDP